MHSYALGVNLNEKKWKCCNDIGYKIKKGWNINIDARSIHHDPTLHNDPGVFNPSRFPVSLHLYFDNHKYTSCDLIDLNINIYNKK